MKNENIINTKSILENEIHVQENSTGTYGKSYTYNINYRPDTDTVQEKTYINLRNTTLDNMSIFSDQTMSFVLHINNTYAQDLTETVQVIQTIGTVTTGETFTVQYKTIDVVRTKSSDTTKTVTVTWTYGALNTSVDMDNNNPLKPETFGEFIADIYRTLAAETTYYADRNLQVNFGFSIATDKDGDVDYVGNKTSNVSVSDTLGLLMENGKLNEAKLAYRGNKSLRFRLLCLR